MITTEGRDHNIWYYWNPYFGYDSSSEYRSRFGRGPCVFVVGANQFGSDFLIFDNMCISVEDWVPNKSDLVVRFYPTEIFTQQQKYAEIEKSIHSLNLKHTDPIIFISILWIIYNMKKHYDEISKLQNFVINLVSNLY
jgi:hypothetical protein